MPRTESHIPARRTGPARQAPTDLEGRLAEMFTRLIRDELAAGAGLGPLVELLRRDAAGVLSAATFPPFEAMVHRAVDRAVAAVEAGA